MPQYSVLLVDDDPKIAKLLQSYFEKEDFAVFTALDGIAALQFFRDKKPDILVLDLMLPGMNGLDVCRQIRRESETPILMLTARVDDTDKIVGLELGADDYVTKPFNSREVVARVRAILRRTKGATRPSSVLQNRGLRLDSQQRLVTLDGRELELTPTEFALLQTLMENANHVFTRRALIETALGYDYEGLERTVDSHIKNIRKKIEVDIANPTYIETVFGMGYRFRTDGETHA